MEAFSFPSEIRPIREFNALQFDKDTQGWISDYVDEANDIYNRLNFMLENE